MPQKRKECDITINHTSYETMEKVFELYNKPHLERILNQQIAYNCAIRKAYIDGMFTNPLFKNIQNLGEYGLDTYVDMQVHHSQDNTDVFISIHSFDKLYLEYPFIKDLDEDSMKDLDTYPIVQRPLNDERRNAISLMLEDTSNLILPIEDNFELPKLLNNINPKKRSYHLTCAFYFFDAEYFYEYTPSMLNRYSHDQRKIKELKKIIKPYIIDSKYIELI